ncbi:nucleotidyl transferase AbiEii/AbiGii toxin family protein [Patescibacteria group bacterium]|nr:nucleotidyl transferase AbiEii/AbiGii toxin family protein [Candidatus Falkowbacteria bacterium]MBU3906346.1 nucleotidyl transferase AbiEii/AbiGii toxin family protein [Patescibacteria group bacterium]MCG2698125.1 nucleotidyl transferase AbiEii/AbiGii toxin family protein [Candidatus Parcubacteria bacterium]MBU4015207.1 nucleotidyl transferase AbiEii/AbiGii toxin family protein [Patescibacteria group bacterium]MBU4026731.1 nucleotidyl transferase AbiEii/AbiGii toxin family protein [Patesciba
MISQEEIKRLSTRSQAQELTIAREYLHHNFLSELYKQQGSDRILFKGGTALRIIFNSPRFSEDLDFTATKNISYQEIENLLMEIYSTLDQWGFAAEIKEAKKTTGGYLAKTIFSFYDYRINLKIEISFRKSRTKPQKEISQIRSEFLPAYDIAHLPQEEIISGKLAALLARSKPRDWYDLYFLLKNDYLSGRQKKLLPDILKKFKNYRGNIRKELKEFLPVSHQLILKDFKNMLKQEIEKFL